MQAYPDGILNQEYSLLLLPSAPNLAERRVILGLMRLRGSGSVREEAGSPLQGWLRSFLQARCIRSGPSSPAEPLQAQNKAMPEKRRQWPRHPGSTLLTVEQRRVLTNTVGFPLSLRQLLSANSYFLIKKPEGLTLPKSPRVGRLLAEPQFPPCQV